MKEKGKTHPTWRKERMANNKEDPVFHLGDECRKALSEKPVMWEKLGHDYPLSYTGH